MLHTVAELPENFPGDIVRELRAEIDADSLRPDDAHNLFDAVAQRRRRILEQQMRFVEYEDELRLVEIPDFGQALEQLGQEP